MNLNQSEHWFILILKSIRVRIDCDSFGLKIYFEFVGIHSDRSLGLSRINFQAFFNKRDSKSFSDWSASARIQISEWFGIVLIGSKWISIQNCRKGNYETKQKLKNFVRIGSDWFALVRIKISEWLGILLIGSEWTPIENLHPIQSETSIRMNRNDSELNFQSDWIRINRDTDWSKPNIQSEWILINPNTDSFSF